MNNQGRRIMNYLESGKRLTSKIAMEKPGIISLTKRISELRSAGFNITDYWEEGKNRYGEDYRYKVYALQSEEFLG